MERKENNELQRKQIRDEKLQENVISIRVSEIDFNFLYYRIVNPINSRISDITRLIEKGFKNQVGIDEVSEFQDLSLYFCELNFAGGSVDSIYSVHCGIVINGNMTISTSSQIYPSRIIIISDLGFIPDEQVFF